MKSNNQTAQNIINAALAANEDAFREAEKAAAERRKAERKKEKERAAQTRREFNETFGLEAEEVRNGNRVIFGAYELRFSSKNAQWRLFKNCKNRKKNDFSHQYVSETWIWDLASIGSFIKAYEKTDLCWNCFKDVQEKAEPEPVLTTEQKLLEIFKQFLAENSYQGEY